MVFCRDAGDETMLINQRDIGTMPRGAHVAVLSKTSAECDQVENVEFSNPLFKAMTNEQKKEEKAMKNPGNDTDSFDSCSEDSEGYTMMSPGDEEDAVVSPGDEESYTDMGPGYNESEEGYMKIALIPDS